MTLLLPPAYTGEGAVSADGDGGSEALLLGHSVCTFLEMPVNSRVQTQVCRGDLSGLRLS